MSHHYANLRAFQRGQARYDAMAPEDESDLTECPQCDARGWNRDSDGHRITCPTCEGHSYLDADGNPYDPDEAREEAAETASADRHYFNED